MSKKQMYLLLTCIALVLAVVQLVSLMINALIKLDFVMLIAALLTFFVGFVLKTYLIGVILMILSLGLSVLFLTIQPMFIAVLLSIVAGGLAFYKYITVSVANSYHSKMQQLNYVVKSEKDKHGKVTPQKWLPQVNNVNETFEWEDVNAMVLFGDTIMHLGKTLLPEGENVLVLTKIYGDIRILLPLDVGVIVHHKTLKGNVFVEHEDYELTNSTLTIYSSNYGESKKTLKIVTTIYVGTLEVVYI